MHEKMLMPQIAHQRNIEDNKEVIERERAHETSLHKTSLVALLRKPDLVPCHSAPSEIQVLELKSASKSEAERKSACSAVYSIVPRRLLLRLRLLRLLLRLECRSPLMEGTSLLPSPAPPLRDLPPPAPPAPACLPARSNYF